jgi:hypothetical protein
MGWVSQAVEKVSQPVTQILQPIEKAINQGVTDIGKTIANSPGLETAITAIAASYGVPPSVTAGFLAANKTSQTGGNLEKGLETFILSYGAGKFLQPGAIDLSTPEAIQQSAQTAQQASVSNAGQNATLERFLGPTGDFPLNGPELSKLTSVSPTIPTGAGANAAGSLFSGASAVPTITPAAIESGLGTAAGTTAGLLGSPIAPVTSAAGSSAGYIGATIPIAAPIGSTLAGLGGSPVAPAASAAGATPGYVSAAQAGLGSTLAGLGGSPVAPAASAAGSIPGYVSDGGGLLSSIGSTLSNLLPSSSTLSSFLPSLITGGLQGLGAANTAEKAREAAQIQADAQIKAAQIAADAAKFRPVGVTTRFGASNFTTDAQGNVIGAGYTASPEIKAYQDRLSALAAQGLTGAEGAQAAYAPLTAGAQSLFNLGQGYLQQTPEQQAAAYIAKQQALLDPMQQQQLAQLQNKLQAQGRGGLSVAQGGNLAATSPELAAYYNALAQSNLQLAAQGQQAGQQQAQFGAGLLGAGSDLMGKYYAGQTAAYSPFATAIDTTTGLESLAQQPLTLGTQIGAKTTASSAEAGRLLGQGMINSAATQAPVNAFSYSGDILSQFANNPQLQAALAKAFAT